MKVKFSRCNSNELASLPTVDGQLTYVKDTSENYLDVGTTRNKISDIVFLENDEALESVTEPLSSKLYYVKTSNQLLHYNGTDFDTINDFDVKAADVLFTSSEQISATNVQEALEQINTKAVNNTTSITELTGDVQTNADNLSTLQSTVQGILQKNTHQDQSISTIETSISDLEESVEQLQNSVPTDESFNQLAERVTNVENKNTQQDTAISAIQTKNTEQDNTISTISGKVTVNEGKIKTLETSVQGIETDISDIKKEQTTQNKAISNIEEDVSTNTTDITNLKKADTTLQNNIDTVSGRVTVNEGNISTLQNTVGTHTTDINSLKSRVTANEGNISTNTQDISDIKEDISTIEGNISSISTTVGQHTSTISTLQSNVNTNTQDIETLESSVGTNTQDIETLETNLGTVEGKVNTNTSDISSLKTRVSTNETDIDNLQSSVSTNTEDISDLKTSVGTLNTTVSGHTTSISQNAQAIESIQEELQSTQHFRGYYSTINEITSLEGHVGDFAYCAEDGYKYVYGETGWTKTTETVPDKAVDKTTIVPLMDGTASIGNDNRYAAGDHRHPTDTTRASVEQLESHTENTSNPHNVTKAQVGLGNVDNTSDLDKPISTLTQQALNNKVDKITGKGLSTNDYTTTEKEKLASLTNYNDTEIKEDITTLQGTVTDLSETVDTVNTTVGTLNTTVTGLSADVGTNKTNITTLQGKVNTLETDVGEVKETVTEINQTVETLNTDVEGLNTDLTSLTNTVSGHTTSIGEIETDVSNIQGTVSNLQTSVNNKVDKITGKGLSTNDFTNTYKSKLDSLENYDDTTITQNVSTLQSSVSTVEQKVSNIEEDVGTNTTDITSLKGSVSTLQTNLGNKVDKVSGKGLSTNDYTTTEKNKLAGIEANANNYTLPKASSTVLGGIKLGANLTMDGNGVVSAKDTNTTYNVMTGATSSTNGQLGLVPAPQRGQQNSFLKGDGTWGTVESATYGEATQDQSGLMSASDKTKLDGIQTGANNYTLPKASTSTLGGIKVGNNLTIENDGTLNAIDTNTTYSVMTGATSNADGESGLVPKPTSGNQNKYLKADGTWSTPTNTTYTNATQSKDGLMSQEDKTKLDGIATNANNYVHPTASGYKHIPSGGQTGQVLKWSADGTAQWGTDNNTTYTNATTSKAGLMSASDKTKLDSLSNYDDTELTESIGTIETSITNIEEDINTLTTTVGNKVDKVTGKGLSTNDYTTTEKSKLSGIASGATKVAKSNTNGNILINGTETTVYTKPDLTKQEVVDALGYTPPTTNTTYNVMTGATSSAAGKSGLVPQPAAGKQTSFLRGDGTWVVPTNTTYTNATTSKDGLMSSEDKTKLDGITAGTSNPLANGTVSVGTSTAYARQDHRHPLQTTVSGNAGSATKLQTARTINGVAFDGTKNITIDVGQGHTILNSSGTEMETRTKLRFNHSTVTDDEENDVTIITPTDTTYSVATTSANGLMSSAMVTKLNGIATGATKNMASSTTPKANGTASVGTEANFARGDHVHPLQTTVSGNAGTATKLATARTITLSGAVTGSTTFDGSANKTITTTLSNIDASKITSGTISIDRLPAAALERCVVVANDTARFDLTASDVQLGDTVKVTATNTMYMVTNTSELDNENGYTEFSAGHAATADQATKANQLTTARTINGTAFNGTANITTAKWGTSRNIYIQDASKAHTGTAVAVDGSANEYLLLPSTITAALSGNATSATTATQIKYTLQNPTSSSTYVLPFVSSASTANKTAYINNGLSYNTLEGTTSATGYGTLILGNSTKSGTAANKYGQIRLYGTSSGYTQIKAGSSTSNFTLTLPNATDTLVGVSASQALTNKTYNGYTLAAACAKGVVTSVDTSANLPTSNAVKTFVEGKGYKTTDNNYYPTTWAWTNGTTSGPTAKLTGSGMSAVAVAAIPSASGTTQSGIVTTGAQTFGGVKTFSSAPKLSTNTLTTSSGYTVTIPNASSTLVNLSTSQSLTNKTYNGLTLTEGSTNFTIKGGSTTERTLTVNASYTLGAACAKGVDTSITKSSTSTNLPTSKAVANLVKSVSGCTTQATSLTCTLPDNL